MKTKDTLKKDVKFKTVLFLLMVAGCAPRKFNKAAVLDSPALPADFVTISLIGTNDFHGSVESQEVLVGPTGSQQKVKVGGVEAVAAYFDIARKANPRTLILDAGDIFQGSFVSNHFQGKSLVDVFNKLKLDASTIGNHEFDFGPREDVKREPNADPLGALKFLTSTATFSYLNANIKTRDGSQLGLPNVVPSKMFTVGNVKVGVIGAVTETTPQNNDPAYLHNLIFVSFKEAVPPEAAKLRAQGAQVIVLLAHAGGSCNMAKSAADGDAACAMPNKDEVTALLDSVPTGTIDAVIGGHNHLSQAHFIRGVPVVQTMGYGKTFSKIDLTVNANAKPTDPKSVRISRVEIASPIGFCHTHFSLYPSCNPDVEKMGLTYPSSLGKPIPAMFLGQTVELKKEILTALKPYQDMVKSLVERRVATLPYALSYDRIHESPISNCVADAVTEQVEKFTKQKIDLGLFYSGGVRAALPAGSVSYGAIYSVLPFDNRVAIAELTGAELEELGSMFSAAPKNISVVSKGWKIKLTKQNVLPNHLSFMRDAEGPTDVAKTYKIITTEFVVFPGGAYEAVFQKVRAENRLQVLPDLVREVFADRLRRVDVKLPATCLGEKTTRTIVE